MKQPVSTVSAQLVSITQHRIGRTAVLSMECCSNGISALTEAYQSYLLISLSPIIRSYLSWEKKKKKVWFVVVVVVVVVVCEEKPYLFESAVGTDHVFSDLV